MSNHDLDFRLKEVAGALMNLTSEVHDLKINSGMNELWDNSDLIRNWKISQRTLSTWRTDGLIDYVQAGSKIWYPREARERFILKNLITSNPEN
ncbi:MAG: hypothetical protein WCI31_07985 [Prolixibacteraceae bacterium]